MNALRLQARTLVRRIDALSVRERAILFVSCVALLGAVADALVLSPQFSQQKAMAQRMQWQNQELAALRLRAAQAVAPAGADDSPRGRALAALRQVQLEQAAVARQRESLATAAGDEHAAAPHDLPQLLTRVLRRHERLTLLSLATVNAGTRHDGSAPAVPRAPSALELRLQGAYPDLLRYVQEVERAVPGQRWEGWQLGTGQGAPILTLRLVLAGGPR